MVNAKEHPSTHTVQAYIAALLESYFFYEIKRFDIKGKEYLRTLGKYYIVDIGLRNFLLDSATGTADTPLRMWSTSNCSAGAMTWPSGRSTIRKWTSSPPRLTTNSIFR